MPPLGRAALWLALLSGLATIVGWLLFFVPFAAAAGLEATQGGSGDPGWVGPTMVLLASVGIALPALASINAWRGLKGRPVRPLNPAAFALVGAVVLLPFALSAQPLVGLVKGAVAMAALGLAVGSLVCALALQRAAPPA